MKFIVIASGILICSPYCQASEQSSSSSNTTTAVASKAVQVASIDVIAEATILLENFETRDGVSSSIPLRRAIKALKIEKKKISSTEGIEEISQCLNRLRLTWAKLLREQAHRDANPLLAESDEIIECIEQLGPTIGSDLVPVQRSWGTKENRQRKGFIVERSLGERADLITALTKEEREWDTRLALAQNEIDHSPDPMEADILKRQGKDLLQKAVTNSRANRALMLQLQEHVGAILSLVDQCKETAKAALNPQLGLDNNNDDDEDDVGENARETERLNKEIDRFYQPVTKRLVRDILEGLQEEEEATTIEEIQSEYSDLVAELNDRSVVAAHVVWEYRRLYNRIQGNREAYTNNRHEEGLIFNAHHTSLHDEHIEHLMLRAQLKLLLTQQQRITTELQLDEYEIDLLKTHKEALFAKEIEALDVVCPGIWTRIWNYFS